MAFTGQSMLRGNENFLSGGKTPFKQRLPLMENILLYSVPKSSSWEYIEYVDDAFGSYIDSWP